jgi:hypothetical protein
MIVPYVPFSDCILNRLSIFRATREEFDHGPMGISICSKRFDSDRAEEMLRHSASRLVRRFTKPFISVGCW